MTPEVVFLILWAAGVVVIWPTWIWWSVTSRRRRGEPLVPRPPADAVFVQRDASGRRAGQLGGVSNCLMVVVTRSEFSIGPVFPFTVLFPYGALGLDHRCSRGGLVAELERNWPGCNVRLTLRDKGETRYIHLRLRDPAGFISALRG